MNKYVAPHWTFEEIRLKWEKTKTLDAKSRLKELRMLVYAVDNTRDVLTLEAALLYMDILKAAQIFGESKSLAELMPKYLKVAGYESVKIITEIQYSQHGEGQIIIGDPMVVGKEVKWHQLSQLDMIKMINAGKIFAFDGEDLIVSDSYVRLVKAMEPVMLTKEYKQLESATPVVIIRIESGTVALLDECGNGVKAEMSLSPGNYRIGAYQLGKRSRGKDRYLIIMCATDKEATNDLKGFPSLVDNSFHDPEITPKNLYTA